MYNNIKAWSIGISLLVAFIFASYFFVNFVVLR